MKTKMLTTIMLIVITVSGTSMAGGFPQIKPQDPVRLPDSAIRNLFPIPVETGIEIVNDTTHPVLIVTISNVRGGLVFSDSAQNLIDRGESLFVELTPGEYIVSICVLENNIDPHTGWFSVPVLHGRPTRLYASDVPYLD